MGAGSAVLIVLITLLFPPAGVFIVAGCGVDLLINILLTILGYFPGHIHAFYLEYTYYERRERAREGRYATGRAPGIYSDRIQSAGGGQAYGTIPAAAPAVAKPGYPQPQQGYAPQEAYPPQQGY